MKDDKITKMIKKVLGFKSSDNFKFIIIGAGRGGTSLLAGLLDCHDELEVGFEQFSEDYLMGKKLHIQSSDILDERVRAFLSGCQREANRFPDKIYGNKITTEQLFALEDHNIANPDAKKNVIHMFFNQYLKGIKVIFILRDGRTCVKSKVSRTGQSVELACERWKYSVQVYKFLKNHHDNNICVKYEDLLLCPKEILKDICDFLGISYQESMLNGTQSGKMRPDYRNERIDTSKLSLVGIPNGCTERIYDDLHFCGYV